MSAEQLITKHLDIWTSAHKTRSSAGRGSSSKLDLYGIKKLRELILELAVRGKLVPQDPNDEPASVLLKRISTQKDALIKDKKIKKNKTIENLNSDVVAFDIPVTWDWSYLNELGDWGAGATPSRSNSAYYGGTIPWFKSGELNGEFISVSEETVTELALKECSLRQNKVGDVLIAMYGATIGKSSIINVPSTTNQAVCACTPFDGVFNRFLLLLLRAFKTRFIDMGAGGAQPNISKEKIVSTIVPIPPFEEQHRIVAKIDELMAFCDELEQAQTDNIAAHAQLVEALLTTLTNSKDHQELQANWQRIAEHFDTLFTTEDSIDQLKQTILQLAVMGKLVPQDPNDEPASELLKKIAAEKAQLIKEGKIKKEKLLPAITDEETPFVLPQGWTWTRLGEISEHIHYGFTASSNTEISDVRLLRITDIQDDKVDWGSVPGCEIEVNKIPQYELFNDDILIARTGGTIGKSYLVKDINLCAVFASYLIRVKHIGNFCPEYKKIYLGSQLYWSQLYSKSMGTGQPNVNGEALKNLVVSVPPLAEQFKIIARVSELMDLCSEFIEQIEINEKIKLSLVDTFLDKACI